MSDKSNIPFYSAYRRCDSSPCEPGSLTRPQYKDFVEQNGAISVQRLKNDFDLDGMIQSSRDECLIYNILERAISDPDILKKYEGSFVDVRSDQISFADHLQRVIDLQTRFDSMPVSVRKMFDNNLHTFIESLRDGSANKVVESYISANSDMFIKKPDVQAEGGSEQ